MGKAARKRKADEATESSSATHDANTPKKRGANKKDKPDMPWVDEAKDHWASDPWAQGDMKAGALAEESSFAVLFPAYREKYLRGVWPALTQALGAHGINATLNLIEGSMTVATTRKTWDPYVIFKARDLVKLLARSVHLQQALKILQDDVHCDIIKVGSLCPNKERFIKRRDRLLGPNGSTLKAVEILTECYVMVQGNTVAVMGPHKGLKKVRKIVEDCFRNYHPVYHIKALMIMRELAADPSLQDESWDRFLPKFEKSSQPKRKKAKKAAKKEYTPFPPAQTPRKVDAQLESGEYFLSEEQKLSRKLEERSRKQVAGVAAKQAEREKRFVAPREDDAPRRARAS